MNAIPQWRYVYGRSRVNRQTHIACDVLENVRLEGHVHVDGANNEA